MNFSVSNLKKLEAFVREIGYVLRYEKGSFNSGYCILLDRNVIIVNRYFTEDVKFQKLIDILSIISIDTSKIVSEQSQKLWEKLEKELNLPLATVEETHVDG